MAAAKKKVEPENAWRVTAHTKEELDRDYPGIKMHITEGGSTVAVTKDSDIISVCVRSDDAIKGKALMEIAIKNGGKKLDSYDGNHGFYVNCGFEPVSWCHWNGKYAPEGWMKGRDDPEDIVFYKYTGKKLHVTRLEAKKHLADFKASVPASSDYDSAQSARDKSI